jgi:Family of unknown function (DUF6166)
MLKNDLLKLLPEQIRLEGDYACYALFIDGKKLSLSKSLKVANHSPTGFNWAYSGSGPAQSALAILLHYWPKEVASKYYQDFKFKFIAGLPHTDFNKEVPLRDIMAEIMESLKVKVFNCEALLKEGYRAGAPTIEAEMIDADAAETLCDCGETRVYRGFTKIEGDAKTYRAFSVCPGCGDEQEF